MTRYQRYHDHHYRVAITVKHGEWVYCDFTMTKWKADIAKYQSDLQLISNLRDMNRC